MTNLNEYLRANSPLLVVILALVALALHTFGQLPVQIDWVTIGLLAIIILAPYAQRLERISVANVEMKLRSEIDQAQEQVDETMEESTKESESQYPPDFYGRINRIQALLSEDPIIAVSDIRSEIYRHIWMFAEAKGINDSQIPTRVLLQQLEDEGVLSHSVCNSVREVIRICNKAIHGGEIKQDEANDLAELGVEVIRYLHSRFHNQVVTPVNSEMISQEDVDNYRESKYEVRSVVPLVDEPRLDTRIVPQSGLDTVLESYHEYAEFLIGIEPVESTSPSKSNNESSDQRVGERERP
jgi:hypothetical protein